MTYNDFTMVKLGRSLCVFLFLPVYEWYKNESESWYTDVSHPINKMIFIVVVNLD